MRDCGCSFDSQVIPTFGANGRFEYWEGEFTYGPATLPITTRLTLDHDFVAIRTDVGMERSLVREHREELHLLLSASQVGYQFESDAESTERLVVRLTAYIHDGHPRSERVRAVLGQLASATRELEHARQTAFRNYRPLIP
jgi:hypothetical protein